MTEKVKVLRQNKIYADIQIVFTIVCFRLGSKVLYTCLDKGGNRAILLSPMTVIHNLEDIMPSKQQE